MVVLYLNKGYDMLVNFDLQECFGSVIVKNYKIFWISVNGLYDYKLCVIRFQTNE